MWTELLAAINSKNEVEAATIIRQMRPDAFQVKHIGIIEQLPLHLAAKNGLTNIVEKLFNKRPEFIEAIDYDHTSALHYAAMEGHAQTIDKLLELKYDLINMKDSYNCTALHYAVKYEAIFTKLLQLEPKLAEVKKTDGSTLLHLAAEGAYEYAVNSLLQLQPDLTNAIDGSGQTALHRAVLTIRGTVTKSQEAIIIKLLEIEPNIIKVIDNDGKTVLHYAAQDNNDKIAGIPSSEMLNMVLHLKDKNSDDLVIKGWLNQSITTFEELINKNPEIADNYYKKSNILFALKRIEEAILSCERALELDITYINKIASNMDITLINSNINGKTAIHIAAENGCDKMMELMLDQIVPEVIKSNDENNITILQDRSELGKEKAASLLAIRTEPKIIIKPLLRAAKEGDKKVVELLLKLVDSKTLMLQDEFNRTPLHWAVQYGHDDIVEMLMTKMSRESLLIEDEMGRTAWHLSSTRTVASKIAKKIGYAPPIISQISFDTTQIDNSTEGLTTNAATETIAKHREDKLPDKSKASSINIQNKPQNYSTEVITELLNIQIGKKALIKMIDLRQKKLEFSEVESLVKSVLEGNEIVVALLQIKNKSFTSLLMEKNGETLQVIHNNSSGAAFAEEKNVKSLIYNIRDIEDTVNTIDLRQQQQTQEEDSAAFAIDNLVTLIKHNTKGLKKHELQKLLPTTQQIDNIKAVHSLIGDTNPWYSDDKLNKLLEIELEGKTTYIAPALILKNKELLTEITQTAVKAVMNSNNPAVIPVHIHGNHWTGIVIKKQADSLQVIYNDPKGDKLANEKHSGTVFKAISKICSKFTTIDLQKSQQVNDDDCGVFTVDNLVKLASCSPNLSITEMKTLLSQADRDGRADDLRMKHANELCDAGIPVVLPDNHIDLTGDFILE